jgi:TetR/AcrR family transcriptional repressor of bet genes
MAQAAEKVESKRRALAKEQRREQLIKAAIASVAKRGLSGTTMAEVTREARLSLGIVNLHFQSKDKLLVEALRYLAEEYQSAWSRALGNAGSDPAARLAALVEVDFSRAVCDRRKIAVWFAFWGEAKSRPTYMKICAQYDIEYQATLEQVCAELIVDGGYADVAPNTVAVTLSAMTDGLWLDYLMTPDRFNAEAAKALCMRYLADVFPRHFPIAQPHASAN